MRPAKELLGPIGNFTEKLSERLGKNVKFELRGGDLLLEPEIWKEVLGNVIHMVRNSIDHGIEAPWERGAKGEQAKVWIDLSKSGNRINLEVGDDGKGISPEAVAQVAVTKNIITADQVLTGIKKRGVLWFSALGAEALVSAPNAHSILQPFFSCALRGGFFSEFVALEIRAV